MSFKCGKLGAGQRDAGLTTKEEAVPRATMAGQEAQQLREEREAYTAMPVHRVKPRNISILA
ncbi:MAG: hypothetical protein M1820_010117 [Bogoriella megaspora]|nr:MAG: hypothetical protein M1820_010117 [Bogoriella megaspora]